MTTTHPDAERMPIEPATWPALFDPTHLAVAGKQRPLRRFRYPDGQLGWLITSHPLARAVLTDRRFGIGGSAPVGSPAKNAAVGHYFERSELFTSNFLMLDPPDHTRYRRAVSGHFTVRQIERHRAAIERIVDEQLDAIEQAGPPVDLLSAFASPVVLATQCELLGLPLEDCRRFSKFSASFVTTGEIDEVRALFEELGDYLRATIRRRRHQPGDDMISHVAAQDDLSEDEILGALLLVFIGGLGTTDGTLALGALALLSNPAQLEALRADPSLIAGAVEELLRYVTTTSVAGTRVALEDVDLAGSTIRAGESVIVSQAAANRDEDKFEAGDALDVQRPATGHLAFGHGVHVCLGQHLVRLELRIAFARLLDRFPQLRLAIPAEDVPLYSGPEGSEFGVHALPVAW